MDYKEKVIKINENRILRYYITNGYTPMYTIKEDFIDNNKVVKNYSLNRWDDYGFNGWINTNNNIKQFNNNEFSNYTKLGHKTDLVANFFSQFNDVMMEMTNTVMKLAPIGVFCLISRTFATVGFSAFLPMLKYMGCVVLALLIQCFGVYQIMLFAFTRLNPIRFVKKFLPVMGFAFSTATFVNSLKSAIIIPPIGFILESRLF